GKRRSPRRANVLSSTVQAEPYYRLALFLRAVLPMQQLLVLARRRRGHTTRRTNGAIRCSQCEGSHLQTPLATQTVHVRVTHRTLLVHVCRVRRAFRIRHVSLSPASVLLSTDVRLRVSFSLLVEHVP